jgi:hypothetical protein
MAEGWSGWMAKATPGQLKLDLSCSSLLAVPHLYRPTHPAPPTRHPGQPLPTRPPTCPPTCPPARPPTHPPTHPLTRQVAGHTDVHGLAVVQGSGDGSVDLLVRPRQAVDHHLLTGHLLEAVDLLRQVWYYQVWYYLVCDRRLSPPRPGSNTCPAAPILQPLLGNPGRPAPSP